MFKGKAWASPFKIIMNSVGSAFCCFGVSLPLGVIPVGVPELMVYIDTSLRVMKADYSQVNLQPTLTSMIYDFDDLLQFRQSTSFICTRSKKAQP